MSEAIPPVLQAGHVIAGKYRIERVLGEGGMGQVLLATHVDLGELCAVKVLHRGALNHPDAYERFVREARVARQIKSQHAVKVYDFGRIETGEPYIVMEFLEGVDLRKLLLQRGRLPVHEAVMYVTQACEALGEAHAAGIIHRDLKPANLFLTKGAHGRSCIKVLDFGIAKMAARPGNAPEREMTGNAMIGTLAYMSPEQMLSSRSVDHRADIWSMGVVLFRLLTDALPFEDTGEGLGIVNSVINGSPTSLAEVNPSFPPGLCAAVACCLQKDREQRYPTAMDLADAISPFFVPEPRPSSARVSRWEQTLEASTRRIPQAQPSSPSLGGGDDEKTSLLLPSPGPAAPLAAADARTGATEASWARTGRRSPEGRSRLWILAVCSMIAVGGAIAAWQLLQGPDPQGALASDPPAPITPPFAAQSSPSAPDAASSAPPVGSAALSAHAAVPGAAAEPPAAPPSAPQMGGSPASNVARPGQPAISARAEKTPVPVSSHPPPTATAQNVAGTAVPPPASDPFKNDRK